MTFGKFFGYFWGALFIGLGVPALVVGLVWGLIDYADADCQRANRAYYERRAREEGYEAGWKEARDTYLGKHEACPGCAKSLSAERVKWFEKGYGVGFEMGKRGGKFDPQALEEELRKAGK